MVCYFLLSYFCTPKVERNNKIESSFSLGLSQDDELFEKILQIVTSEISNFSHRVQESIIAQITQRALPLLEKSTTSLQILDNELSSQEHSQSTLYRKLNVLFSSTNKQIGNAIKTQIKNKVQSRGVSIREMVQTQIKKPTLPIKSSTEHPTQ